MRAGEAGAPHVRGLRYDMVLPDNRGDITVRHRGTESNVNPGLGGTCRERLLGGCRMLGGGIIRRARGDSKTVYANTQNDNYSLSVHGGSFPLFGPARVQLRKTVRLRQS